MRRLGWRRLDLLRVWIMRRLGWRRLDLLRLLNLDISRSRKLALLCSVHRCCITRGWYQWPRDAIRLSSLSTVYANVLRAVKDFVVLVHRAIEQGADRILLFA